MTQQQIKASLTGFYGYLVNPYAAKLSQLCKLIKEFKEMPEYTIQLAGINSQKETIELYSNSYACKGIFEMCDHWQKIAITHNAGSYVFNVPVDTKFYSLFMAFIGANVETKKEPAADPIKTILINSEVLQAIGKAFKFVSKDDLRPAMTAVCLTIENYLCEVVATDAHRLYYSPKFQSSEAGRVQYLIPAQVAKEVAKIKTKEDEVLLSIYKDNKAEMCGITFDLLDARYPDYPAVIPAHDKYMTFDRANMLKAVKCVLPSCNKSTNQINFYLNGCIEMTAADVDFEFEAKQRAAYIDKNFPDVEIGFNGKMLVDAFGMFKDNTVKMYHNGKATTGAIFTNGSDSVLQMPLMINND